MKKILLYFTLILSSITIIAKDTTHSTLNKISNGMIILHKQGNEKLKNLQFLPTLIRTSQKQNGAWQYISNVRIKIENQKKIELYELSNSLTDTIRRILYTYDNFNRLQSETYEEMNQLGFMTPTRRFIYSYVNVNNELTTTTIIEDYIHQTSNWQVKQKQIQGYNSRGVLIKSADYSFNNNTWLINHYDSKKINYLNDTTNKTTEIIDSSFHILSGSMIVYRKALTSYDSQGRETEFILYTPSSTSNDLVLDKTDIYYYSNKLTPEYIVRYTYTDLGDIDTRIKFEDINFKSFNTKLNVFENEIQSYKIYYWNQNQFDLNSRYSVTYPDNYGSKIELLERFENIEFIPLYKDNYLYNSKYDLIEESSYEFNTNTFGWEINSGNKYKYQYDNNNYTTELISQYYNSINRNYVDDYKYDYSEYQLLNTSIQKTAIGSITIYPNPVKENIIKINLNLNNENAKSIRIINLQGQLVLDEITYYNDTLNIEDLQSGIYFLEVITENNNKVITKFIKQ